MKNDNIIIVAMLGVAAFLVMKGTQAKTGTRGMASSLGGLFGNTSAALANLNPLQLLGLGTTTYDSRSQSVGSISAADPYSTGGYNGGNGWTYYNDGSAVDPEGNLWWQGQKVGSAGTINYYQEPGQVNTEIVPTSGIGYNWI